MRILKNQVIARPTVLDYNGKSVLKKWGNLKKYIGKKVRVTIEHPRINPTTNEFETGLEVDEVTIKKCPKGKTLCADLPDHQKTGYSIGYSYTTEKEDGIFEGKPYEFVRKLNGINHIALVANPRDAMLVKVAGDSINPCSATDGICYVNIYPKIRIGVDSYVFEDTLMPTEIEKLTADLNAANKLAADSAKIAADYKKQNLSLMVARTKVAVDSLESLHGFEPKTWEGKTPDYVDGALYALNIQKARDALSSNAEYQEQDQDAEQAQDGYLDINDLTLDANGNFVI